MTIVETSAPVADAGPDQTKDEGATVMLDESGSDPDFEDSLGVPWTQVLGPSVALSDRRVPRPSFTALAVGAGGETLVFDLVVTDDDPVNPKSSIPDEVVVIARNINDPPSCRLAMADRNSPWLPWSCTNNHTEPPDGGSSLIVEARQLGKS